jgi:hypothetical protein
MLKKHILTMWTGLIWFRIGVVVDEQGNEPSSSLTGGESLEQRNQCCLLQKDYSMHAVHVKCVM